MICLIKAVHVQCIHVYILLFYVIFTRAETLAAEIKELQKEMADYNTVCPLYSTGDGGAVIVFHRIYFASQLMDKLNTDTDMAAIMADFTAVRILHTG